MDKNSNVIGIIFKISLSKQEDKLISILNDKGEKIQLLAKGVRKHTSKRSQSLELGNYIQAKFVSGYNVGILTDIKVISEFLEWKKDFKGMIYLQLLFEILSFFSFENNTEPRLFKLLFDILSSDLKKIEYLISIFSLKLLSITGHLPELNKDINTSESINSHNAILSNSEIGYVRQNEEIYNATDERIYKTQRFILENDLFTALKINLEQIELKKMMNIHLNWIELVVDKRIKSRDVLKALKD